MICKLICVVVVVFWVGSVGVQVVNDYLINVWVDYVFVCMVMNGQICDMLDCCFCVIDQIVGVLFYDDYVKVEIVLLMCQIFGECVGMFWQGMVVNDMVVNYCCVEVEVEILCFQGWISWVVCVFFCWIK